MLIPLGTERPLRRSTVVTYGLMAVNVAVFCLQLFLSQSDPDRSEQLMKWGEAGKEGFRWWQLVTAGFLHAGYTHVGFNMLFLYVFGPNLEDRLGRLWYLAFFLAGGAAAMGLHVAVDPHPAIGASGSVAALTGAYLVMFPRTHIKIFSMWSMSVIWIAAWWFIGIAIVYDLAAGGFGARTGVAHFAHLGGYAFGAGTSFVLLGLKLIPGEPYDLFFQAKQAYRKRQIRSAHQISQRNIETKLSPDSRARSAEADRLAAMRAEVTRLIVARDFAAASREYKELANTFGHLPQATVLSRQNQYDLAGWLYGQGDFASAAYAYDKFLEAYPRDSESPQILLLLGRINARHLNDPVRAKQLLLQAVKGLRDDSAKLLAKTELEALG